MATFETRLKRAKELSAKGEDKWMEAEAELRQLTIGDKAPAAGGKVSASRSAEIAKAREEAALTLADLYAARGSAEKLTALLEDLRPLFAVVPKAKTAKIVRAIIDAVSRIPGTTALQLQLCREQAAWAREEKRTFLRQRIETRLASLLFATKDYQGALALIGTLLSEVKRLDDKLLLVDIHLLESRVHHALRNLPKSKAALTAARTAANAIYVPPATQAEIDCQSGTLHAEEKDYKTAYSYLYEAFEQSVDETKAGSVLKHMLLMKVMAGAAEDVQNIVATKGVNYAGDAGVKAMVEIAAAYQARSIQQYQRCLSKHAEELSGDSVASVHLASLGEKMLEGSILRQIEPYSSIEVSHLAGELSLDESLVEAKISKMILDGVVHGTLSGGLLILYDDPQIDESYKAAIETFETLGHVVDTLMKRSTKIVSL